METFKSYFFGPGKPKPDLQKLRVEVRMVLDQIRNANQLIRRYGFDRETFQTVDPDIQVLLADPSLLAKDIARQDDPRKTAKRAIVYDWISICESLDVLALKVQDAMYPEHDIQNKRWPAMFAVCSVDMKREVRNMAAHAYRVVGRAPADQFCSGHFWDQTDKWAQALERDLDDLYHCVWRTIWAVEGKDLAELGPEPEVNIEQGLLLPALSPLTLRERVRNAVGSIIQVYISPVLEWYHPQHHVEQAATAVTTESVDWSYVPEEDLGHGGHWLPSDWSEQEGEASLSDNAKSKMGPDGASDSGQDVHAIKRRESL